MGRGKQREKAAASRAQVRPRPLYISAQAPPARVVLSRKGFDTGSGGGASPVLPDGRMLSLPIPDGGRVGYGDVAVDGRPLVGIMNELGYSRYRARTGAHLDPDLLAASRLRETEGFRGLLGQVDQSASHLERLGVRGGDLFLFWGRFRQAEQAKAGLRFAGPTFHAVFGYLEVEKLAGAEDDLSFAQGFPHLSERYQGRKNQIYLAREKASWDQSLPGFGVFRYSEALRLTAPGQTPSRWTLPACCHPDAGASLSYHDKAERWGHGEDGQATLQSVARGQEFVFEESTAVTAWARELVSSAERWQ